MRIIDINKEQLINFLVDTSIRIGEGSNGIVSIYDNQTLIKIHYKDIINSYYSNDFDSIDEEIEEKLALENKMKQVGFGETNRLKQLINKLEKSNSKLIEGIVMYRKYPIGVLLKYYSGYKSLGYVLLNLTDDEKIIVYNKIEMLLYNLVECGIYMSDIKFDNIVIDENTLDVKIIDLDDQETTIRDNPYSKAYTLRKIANFLDLYNSYISDKAKKKDDFKR